ncbi:MAG: hypothetical protein H6706_00375 [Myxococcales bacterium]|nr:hypothetical protein [Myxococcales bacterium]
MRQLLDRVGIWPLLTALLVLAILVFLALRGGDAPPPPPPEPAAEPGVSRVEAMAEAVLCIQNCDAEAQECRAFADGEKPRQRCAEAHDVCTARCGDQP